MNKREAKRAIPGGDCKTHHDFALNDFAFPGFAPNPNRIWQNHGWQNHRKERFCNRLPVSIPWLQPMLEQIKNRIPDDQEVATAILRGHQDGVNSVQYSLDGARTTRRQEATGPN